MKKRVVIMLAGLLFGQVAGAHAAGTRRALAQAETSDKAITVADIIPVCERAMDEAISGRDPSGMLEDAFKSLPPDQRGAAMGVCQVYLTGAVTMLKRLREAPKLPAGGTSI